MSFEKTLYSEENKQRINQTSSIYKIHWEILREHRSQEPRSMLKKHKHYANHFEMEGLCRARLRTDKRLVRAALSLVGHGIGIGLGIGRKFSSTGVTLLVDPDPDPDPVPEPDAEPPSRVHKRSIQSINHVISRHIAGGFIFTSQKS